MLPNSLALAGSAAFKVETRGLGATPESSSECAPAHRSIGYGMGNPSRLRASLTLQDGDF